MAKVSCRAMSLLVTMAHSGVEIIRAVNELTRHEPRNQTRISPFKTKEERPGLLHANLKHYWRDGAPGTRIGQRKARWKGTLKHTRGARERWFAWGGNRRGDRPHSEHGHSSGSFSLAVDALAPRGLLDGAGRASVRHLVAADSILGGGGRLTPSDGLVRRGRRGRRLALGLGDQRDLRVSQREKGCAAFMDRLRAQAPSPVYHSCSRHALPHIFKRRPSATPLTLCSSLPRARV